MVVHWLWISLSTLCDVSNSSCFMCAMRLLVDREISLLYYYRIFFWLNAIAIISKICIADEKIGYSISHIFVSIFIGLICQVNIYRISNIGYRIEYRYRSSYIMGNTGYAYSHFMRFEGWSYRWWCIERKKTCVKILSRKELYGCAESVVHVSRLLHWIRNCSKTFLL